MIMKERRPELVPVRTDGTYSRQLAVDFLFLAPDGSVLTNVSLLNPVLLCFQLTEDQTDAREDDPSAIVVQYFDENVDPAEWLTLPPRAGWEGNQLCAELEHLSLFALATKAVLLDALDLKGAASATPPAISEPAPELYVPPEIEK